MVIEPEAHRPCGFGALADLTFPQRQVSCTMAVWGVVEMIEQSFGLRLRAARVFTDLSEEFHDRDQWKEDRHSHQDER
jgi:hypothetical protein